MSRVRERVSTFTGYRTENFGSHVTNGRTIVSKLENCVDEVLLGDNWPLSINKYNRSGGLINGIGSSLGYTWDDYPCAYADDPYLTTHLTISGAPSTYDLAVEMTKRTQPYRPSFVSLEYLEDLKDVGGLLFNKMGSALSKLSKVVPARMWPGLRRAAKLTLLEQFVILPLISDIEVLFKFQSLVDSRCKEINRLYGERGLRRTKHLWNGSNVANISGQTIQSQGVLLHARVTKTTTIEINGHIRWYAIFPIKPSDASIRSRVRREIIGADLNPYSIYQLIPWSWFIDYFTNLGDLCLGAKNMFELYHLPVTISSYKRTHSITTNHDKSSFGGNDVTCTQISNELISINRGYATPSLTARQELLKPAQTSILGSLAILKLS